MAKVAPPITIRILGTSTKPPALPPTKMAAMMTPSAPNIPSKVAISKVVLRCAITVPTAGLVIVESLATVIGRRPRQL